ncbi:hypothetical protein QJS10_CPB12g01341 [Acorus calamus]|uniref:Uncharacterized protein n=1 Tax=Acorus calamus TaxID=4465 RepID=A0AAV9DQB7_ACOCL|nr:hypothetical protein QJS10_CPB12g01341 [Acorus calamus]
MHFGFRELMSHQGWGLERKRNRVKVIDSDSEEIDVQKLSTEQKSGIKKIQREQEKDRIGQGVRNSEREGGSKDKKHPPKDLSKHTSVKDEGKRAEFLDKQDSRRKGQEKRSGRKSESDDSDFSGSKKSRSKPPEKMMKGGRKHYNSEDSDTDSSGSAGKTKKHQKHSSDDSSDSDMQLQNKRSNVKQRSRREQNSDSSENEYDAHVGSKSRRKEREKPGIKKQRRHESDDSDSNRKHGRSYKKSEQKVHDFDRSGKNVEKDGRSKKHMVRHDSDEEDSEAHGMKNSSKRRSGRHAKSKMLTDSSDGIRSSSDSSDDSSSEAQSGGSIDHRHEPLSRRKVGEGRREKENYMEAGKNAHRSALEPGHGKKTGERADARKERTDDQFRDDSRGIETSDGMRRSRAFESKDMKDTDYGEGKRSKRKLDDDDSHDIQEKRSRKLDITEGEKGRIGEDRVERGSDRRDYLSRGERKREEGQAEIERGRTGDYPSGRNPARGDFRSREDRKEYYESSSKVGDKRNFKEFNEEDHDGSKRHIVTGDYRRRSEWRREEYDGGEEIRNKDRYNTEERDIRGELKEADRNDGVKEEQI